MVEIDVLRAQIVRQDLNQPWGFRLGGGTDVGEPLTIVRVAGGSPAAYIGLLPGDEVTEIGGRPTVHLTNEDALRLIAQYGDCITLTIERRADTIEVNNHTADAASHFPPDPPVTDYRSPTTAAATYSFQDAPVHDYQAPEAVYSPQEPAPRPNCPSSTATYFVEESPVLDYRSPGFASSVSPGRDYMSHQPVAGAGGGGGGRGDEDVPEYRSPCYTPSMQTEVKPIDFCTVQSRPFDGRPPKHVPYQQQQSPTQFYRESSPTGHYGETHGLPQSRTFKILQSVMQNNEPGAGVSGLPPPRSAAMEQMKRERAYQTPSSPGGRVKVLMSPKYNSPLGMYSANNVLETFVAQADSLLNTRPQGDSGPEYGPVYGSNSHY